MRRCVVICWSQFLEYPVHSWASGTAGAKPSFCADKWCYVDPCNWDQTMQFYLFRVRWVESNHHNVASSTWGIVTSVDKLYSKSSNIHSFSIFNHFHPFTRFVKIYFTLSASPWEPRSCGLAALLRGKCSVKAPPKEASYFNATMCLDRFDGWILLNDSAMCH